jgi:hypothetical protein
MWMPSLMNTHISTGFAAFHYGHVSAHEKLLYKSI